MSRHVRTLRIQAPRDELARGAAFALGDALRCASLPDDARCYFLRRLTLPRAPTLTAQGYARLIEQEFHALARGAVRGDAAHADHAPAVVFADRAAALAHVALGVAAGRAPQWFWPAAAPGWRAGLAPVEALARLCAHALERPEGRAEVAVVCASLAAAGHRALQERLSELGAAPTTAARAREPARPSVSRSETARLWSVAGPVDAPAPQTTAAPAAVSHDLPATPTPHATPVASKRGDATAPFAPAARQAGANTPSHDHVAGPAPLAVPCAPRPRAQPPAAQAITALPASTAVAPSPPAPDAAPQLLASDHAGLLFVLNPLSRLGLADWLAAHPDAAGLPALLLRDLARRLKIADDDPVLAWLPLPAPDAALARPLSAWRQLLRRACRVHAGIGLADLAHRPGRLLASHTHLDVFLDPTTVELRVRRAGLDLDPGWLPWLARVVRFHYSEPLREDERA